MSREDKNEKENKKENLNLMDFKKFIHSYDIELYDEIINHLNDIDFEKIIKVMDFMNWKYWKIEKMTIEIIKTVAEELLFEGVYTTLVKNLDNYSLGTGGFEVTVSKFISDSESDKPNNEIVKFNIAFIIESVDNYE